MRKLALDPEMLIVQSFRTDAELAQLDTGPIADSPLCAPTEPFNCP